MSVLYNILLNFLQSIDTNNADEILKVLNGNTSELEPVDIGWLYSILGRIFINSDQSKSLEYYTKAKEVFMQIENFFMAARES